MGGRPLLALAILGMPLGKLAPGTVREILAGGASICSEAGIPIAGGHSIDAPEPLYGLAVIGLVDPRRVLRNSGARAGDVLTGLPNRAGLLSRLHRRAQGAPEANISQIALMLVDLDRLDR